MGSNYDAWKTATPPEYAGDDIACAGCGLAGECECCPDCGVSRDLRRADGGCDCGVPSYEREFDKYSGGMW